MMAMQGSGELEVSERDCRLLLPWPPSWTG
jgi:hypothetical protein